jgi:hypothetical protein
MNLENPFADISIDLADQKSGILELAIKLLRGMI